MYKLYNGLVGSKLSNTEIKYFDQHTLDSRANYLKNLKQYPEELIYFNSVTHKFNNIGHRCKNIDEIDFKNYILFIGCSNTFGLGNYVEDTYPYLLSKKLNMDYYNLGVYASGTDVHIHNFSVWTQTMPVPKLIVWQWTGDARITGMPHNEHETIIYPFGPWLKDEEVSKFFISSDILGIFKFRRNLAEEILKISKIPIIQIDVVNNPGIIHFKSVDFSRDIKHLGPKSHSNVSESIYNYYLNKYSNNYAI